MGKIYISGPITGTTDYMERFQKAEDAWTEKGYSVINPAAINARMPADTTHAEYMKVCMALLDLCSTIFMMDGWKNSIGAKMELDHAETYGIKVIYETKPKKIKGMDYEKWLVHRFSTGSYAGEDYLKFQREMRTDLRRLATDAGMSVAQFHKNHYCFSAVLKNPEGRLVYVSVPDVRGFRPDWYENVLYRVMRHEKDWSGCRNHFTKWPDIGRAAAELCKRSIKEEEFHGYKAG